MLAITHTHQQYEDDSKLEALGLDRKELVIAAYKAIAGRNGAIAIDPINAPGQLAYIHGTRAVREMLLPKGCWEIDRTDNIEATLNTSTGVKIIYQNTDCAADPFKEPKAISGKGQASKRLVANATGYLFPEMEAEDRNKENRSIWFLCVSVEGEKIRAELSCPRSIEGGQFADFIERIFLIDGSEIYGIDISPDETDIVEELEIKITRK